MGRSWLMCAMLLTRRCLTMAAMASSTLGFFAVISRNDRYGTSSSRRASRVASVAVRGKSEIHSPNYRSIAPCPTTVIGRRPRSTSMVPAAQCFGRATAGPGVAVMDFGHLHLDAMLDRAEVGRLAAGQASLRTLRPVDAFVPDVRGAASLGGLQHLAGAHCELHLHAALVALRLAQDASDRKRRQLRLDTGLRRLKGQDAAVARRTPAVVVLGDLLALDGGADPSRQLLYDLRLGPVIELRARDNIHPQNGMGSTNFRRPVGLGLGHPQGEKSRRGKTLQHRHHTAGPAEAAIATGPRRVAGRSRWGALGGLRAPYCRGTLSHSYFND